MKTKTIEKIIAGTMRRFTNSIEDEALRADVYKCLIVTGGCITSLVQGEPVNDYDVYLTNIDVTKRLAQYYVKRFGLKADEYQVLSGADEDDQQAANALDISLFKDQVKVYIPGNGVLGDPAVADGEDPALELIAGIGEGTYSPVFISPNAITLTQKVQIVTRFVGTASEIHKNFDFVHAFNYWTPHEGLELNLESLTAIIGKELIYRGSRYPLASIIRTRKFIKRGWTINAGQYLKMCVQLNSMDLLDPQVLEEQLVGVDSAYFAWFLTELNNAIEDGDATGRLDETFMIRVVEKVFG